MSGFSSINGGLSDYLDPGFNCYKIAAYSKEYDIQRILKLLNNWKVPVLPEEFLAEYRHENIIKRLEVILDDLNDFFDHKKDYPGNINNLTKIRLTQLRLQTLFNKVKKKYFKI